MIFVVDNVKDDPGFLIFAFSVVGILLLLPLFCYLKVKLDERKERKRKMKEAAAKTRSFYSDELLKSCDEILKTHELPDIEERKKYFGKPIVWKGRNDSQWK